MFKYLKKIVLSLIIFITSISFVSADNISNNKNLVNIYLFYSDSCPHCASEKELLNELMDDYDNIRLYKYEIGDSNNSKLLDEVANLLETSVTGVPLTVIGNKVYKGFSYENSKPKFIATIEYFSNYEYQDIVGEYIGGIELPNYSSNEETSKENNNENNPDINEYIEDYGNVKLDIPLIGTVNTKNLTLPVISILIGLVDGFNPCAMWVLLFLISMLISMKNKKRMFIIGITFLLSSALIYLLFMIAWLNVASLLLTINYVRTIIGLIAIGGAIFNLISYLKHRKDNGCTVVNDKKRNKIFARIRKFTEEKNLLLALIGVVLLACSVNIVELACSAGLPVMFIEILSLNNLTLVEEILYIALYMFFFLLDDLIIFFIAMKTMEVTGFSTKYGKLSKLVGGLLLLGIGLLLIFKPEWLMFNF